jgi:hypothetical protein
MGDVEVVQVYSEMPMSVEDIRQRLQSPQKTHVWVLTTYQSGPKVLQALDHLPSLFFSATLCDEAHHLHTPQRVLKWRLDGAMEGGVSNMSDTSGSASESTAEGASGSTSEIAAESASESVPDHIYNAGLDGSLDTCMDASMETSTVDGEEDEEDASSLDTLCQKRPLLDICPWLVHATATPSPIMRRYPGLYGHPETEWFHYRYADLLRDQDPAHPLVKAFDLSIVVGGVPTEASEPEEFFDWVAILRQVASDPCCGRVKVYHRRARQQASSDKVEVRSAEYFATSDVWRRALAYLHSRGEAPRLTEAKVEMFHAHGQMVRSQTLDGIRQKFNEPCTEDGQVRILCSCRVFGEGVTLNRVDLTVFADGKTSVRDIVQSGLRGVRASVENPTARLRILLLTAIDHADLGELSRKSTVDDVSMKIVATLQRRNHMEHIATVLAALKDEDDTFKDALLTEMSQALQVSPDCVTVCSDRVGRGHPCEKGSGQRSPESKLEPRSEAKPKRLTLEVAPEFLTQWTTSAKELAAAQARTVASMVIELQNRQNQAQRLVAAKVFILCRIWPGNEVPKKGDKVSVPDAVLDEACDGDPVLGAVLPSEFDGGGFLNNIRGNFLNNGQRPHTLLGELQKEQIRQLPWCKLWMQGSVQSLVTAKVSMLCRMWPGHEMPNYRVKVPVPDEVLDEACGGDPTLRVLLPPEFDGGRFLSNIRPNFVDNGSCPHTLLEELQKQQIRQLPWFNLWMQGSVQSLVAAKVLMLCRMWPGHEMPNCGVKVPVPDAVLDEACGGDPTLRVQLPRKFTGGMFLQSIRGNFVDNGSRPVTLLEESQNEQIRQLPWFNLWMRGADAAVVAAKVFMLCKMWPGAVLPKQGIKVIVLDEVLDEACGGDPALRALLPRKFRGGNFLNHIRGNFVNDGSRPHTLLEESQKQKIRQLPWFHLWARGTVQSLVTAKVFILCSMWPGTVLPKYGKKVTVPDEVLDKACGGDPALRARLPRKFNGGQFLDCIRGNFVDDGSRPKTLLEELQKEQIRQLPWCNLWIHGSAKALVTAKVHMLCGMWPGNETPKKGKKVPVPIAILDEACGGDTTLRARLPSEFDSGGFLLCIRGNFVDNGSRPDTLLEELQKEQIRQLPWFGAWFERLGANQQKKRGCGAAVPKAKSKASIEDHASKRRRLTPNL